MVMADDAIVNLTWTPPFTLDIPGVDPDIAGYCVDVVNSTSSATLHSQCGINVTEYTFPLPHELRACDVISCIVTPVNVVGRGQSETTTFSMRRFK